MRSEYSKSYSASSRYFHGKQPTIIHSFTAAAYVSITFVIQLFPFSSFLFELFFSSNHIPCSNGNMYTTVYFTDFHSSILMCNGLLSNWNWWNSTQLELKKDSMVKKFTVKKFRQMPATTAFFTVNYFHMNIFSNNFFPNYGTCILHIDFWKHI